VETGRAGEDVPTPADANARLVRTYAKKVRSDARWSRATEPVFCRVSERLNGSGAAAEASSLPAFRRVEDVGAEGPSRGSFASMRECRHGRCVSSSESEVGGQSRDLDKDKGERAGALAGSGDIEERFREREEDMDKSHRHSFLRLLRSSWWAKFKVRMIRRRVLM